jgi:hypothetical protein
MLTRSDLLAMYLAGWRLMSVAVISDQGCSERLAATLEQRFNADLSVQIGT